MGNSLVLMAIMTKLFILAGDTSRLLVIGTDSGKLQAVVLLKGLADNCLYFPILLAAERYSL